MPKIIALLGLQGSGKSTKAKALISDSCVRVNKDLIREMLWFNEYSSEREELVRVMWRATIAAALQSGRDVIVDDAGNLNPSNQQKLEAIAAEMNAELVYDRSFLDVPIEECIRRDLLRPRSVGEAVICSFAQRYLPKPERVPNPNLPDCLIVDVDGVLADMGDRKPDDYMAAGADKLIPAACALLKGYENIEVVLVTGREERSREVLTEWLDRNFIAHSGIIHMRPDGNRDTSDKFKRQVLEEKILPHYNVTIAIDDDPKVIAMYKALGIPAIHFDL